LYTYMNPVHSAIYGYGVGGLIGKSWRDLYGFEQQVTIEKHYLLFMTRVGNWRGELLGRKKTGEPFDVKVALQQFSRNEEHTSNIICTCDDIVESKPVATGGFGSYWQKIPPTIRY
jgi:two-component system, sensor histidine kinase and response regulator